MIQKQTDRIAELEEDNNIYAEEVITNISKAKNIKANHGRGFLKNIESRNILFWFRHAREAALPTMKVNLASKKLCHQKL